MRPKTRNALTPFSQPCDEANALQVGVRDRLAENTRDDLALTQVPLLPITAVPHLRLGDHLAPLVKKLDSRKVALVVRAHANGSDR